MKSNFPKILARKKHIQICDSKKRQSGKFWILADYTLNILPFEVETLLDLCNNSLAGFCPRVQRNPEFMYTTILDVMRNTDETLLR